MHFVEVGGLEDRRPTFWIYLRQSSHSRTLLYDIRSERKHTPCIVFKALDRNQPTPVDILVVFEDLFLVNLQVVIIVVVLAMAVQYPAFLVLALVLLATQKGWPEISYSLKHL